MASSANETHNSNACCSADVPASTFSDPSYNPQGTYRTLADTKCYITGPSNARKAILYHFDVFGLSAPSLQGADLLASLGSGSVVVMPDLLDGAPADPAWFELPQEQRMEKFGTWRSKIADAAPILDRVSRVVDAAQKEYTGVEKWGAIGFCWGAKLVALSSVSPGTRWTAGVQSSPGRIDPADAAKTAIPTMVLASRDEPAADVAAYGAALTQAPKHVETFEDQIHGWMSARADLTDEKVRMEYERGYRLAGEWFERYL